MNSKHKQKHGFTLTEVLVTLGIVSIVLPLTLATNLHLMAVAAGGATRNEAAANARKVQLEISRKINASGLPTRVAEEGNTLFLRHYNENTKTWADAALRFNEQENTLVYYSDPDGQSGNFHSSNIVATLVYRYKKRPFFEKTGENGEIRCNLFTAKQRFSYRKKSLSDSSGIFLELTAAPRNKGKI